MCTLFSLFKHDMTNLYLSKIIFINKTGKFKPPPCLFLFSATSQISRLFRTHAFL